MVVTFKPNHIKRYKDITFLLMKYGGQASIFKGTDLQEIFWEDTNSETSSSQLEKAGEVAHERTGALALDDTNPESKGVSVTAKHEDFAADLEKLGTTFIKLGQFLATRPDVLPLPYLQALTQVGKGIEPLAFSEVEKVVESEIGMSLSEAFQSFAKIPMAVSTIEQTHRATLHDGKRVIVKIQRSGVQDEIYDDLSALDEIAQFYDQHLKGTKTFNLRNLLEEFRKTIIAELDYRQEAHNLRVLKVNLKDLDLIVVPDPIERYSTPRLLAIAYIEGKNLSESTAASGLLQSERAKLAEQVFYAYVQQILVDGFVHAKLDPANVLLTSSGKVALLDLGIVARIAPAMQQKLLQILLSITEGQADNAADLILTIAEKMGVFDESSFRQEIAELVLVHRDMAIEQLAIGKVLLGIAQASVKYELSLPSEFSMLGNTLFKLDRIAHILDPKFDSNDFIRRNMTKLTQGHLVKTFSPTHFFQGIMESAELLEKLPGKVGKILDSIAENRFKVTINAIDEQVLIYGFQKIANRITTGLVLASLIVGAAMLMRVPTTFVLWGYPGLAMLCFLAAAGFGFALVLEILISDHKAR